MAKLQKTAHRDAPTGTDDDANVTEAVAADAEAPSFERRRNLVAQCSREWTADKCERMRRALPPDLIRRLFLVCARIHQFDAFDAHGNYCTQRYDPCTPQLTDSLVRLCRSHLAPADDATTALFPKLPASVQSCVLSWCATRDTIRTALTCRAALRLARLPASWHTVDLTECASLGDFAWPFPEAPKRAHTLRFKPTASDEIGKLCDLAVGAFRAREGEIADEDEKEDVTTGAAVTSVETGVTIATTTTAATPTTATALSNPHVRRLLMDVTRIDVGYGLTLEHAMRLVRTFPELRELEILASASQPPSDAVLKTLLDGLARLASLAIRVDSPSRALEKRRSGEPALIVLPPTLERYVDECGGGRDRCLLLPPPVSGSCALRAIECTRRSRFIVDADDASRLARRLPLLATLRHRPVQSRGNAGANSLAERAERAWADAIATLPALTCLEWPCLPSDGDAETKAATPIRIERAQFWVDERRLLPSRSFRFLSAWTQLRDLRINCVEPCSIPMQQLIASVCGAVDSTVLRYLQLPWDGAAVGYAFIDAGDRWRSDRATPEKTETEATGNDSESPSTKRAAAEIRLLLSAIGEAAVLALRTPSDNDDDDDKIATASVNDFAPGEASHRQLPHTRGFGPTTHWRHLPATIADPHLGKLLRNNCIVAFGEAAPSFDATPSAVYRRGDVCPYGTGLDSAVDEHGAETCHCAVAAFSVKCDFPQSLTLVEAARIVGFHHQL